MSVSGSETEPVNEDGTVYLALVRGGVEIMVTVWPDGGATLAMRRGDQSFGPPVEMRREDP